MMHSGDANDFFATARIEVRYRRPTPTGTPLVAIGWVERYGSRARVKGQLCLKEGVDGPDPVVLAECDSLVVRPQPGFLDLWDKEVPYWRVYSDEELEAYKGAG
jgi:hypothetical protein